MTGRERVLAALDGLEPDRVPLDEPDIPWDNIAAFLEAGAAAG